jgi:arylformamidase
MMPSRIIDITVPIKPGMTVWPGDPPVEVDRVCAISQGDESNVSRLRMSVHTGTHIDAPRHFLEDGKTIEQIPLEKLTGQAYVMVIGDDISVISKATLEHHPAYNALLKVRKVLFKTGNSMFWPDGTDEFQQNYVGLDASAAQFLAELGMDLVGVDYLSIAPFDETKEPHQILLSKEVVLLEGIDLSEVQEGYYDLYCLPLLLEGSEGAPARAILVSDPEG